jgi:mediator of RNA polymerase II transcription subunit 25
MQQQNQPMMQNQPQGSQMMVQGQQNPQMMNAQNPNMQMQNQQMINQQKQGMMQNQLQNPNMPMQNPQMLAQGQQNPQMMQNQQGNQGQMQNPQMMPQRERIWVGILEWNDKQNQQNQVRQVPCEIYASLSKETNEPEIRGDTWPNRLIMQLMPKTVISNVGGQMLRDARVVQFQWGNSEAFESLSKVMANGFAGCVHFTGPQQCDVKILILLYMQDKKSYYGMLILFYFYILFIIIFSRFRP